ncbi:MAG: IS66 family transposase [Niameybacter sp.]
MKTTEKFPSIKDQLNNLSKDQLISLCGLLMDKNEEYESRLDYLTEQVLLTRKQKFGPSSEKLEDGAEQMSLFFNEAELIADTCEEPTEEIIEVPSHKRKKQKGKRDTDLSQFPVITIEHKLSDEEMSCEKCGGDLKVVKKEVRRYLRFVPSHFETEEHIIYVYGCKDHACEHMVRADKEPSLLRGSIATPSLIAAIMNGKYTNGMPLARQEAEFKRYNVCVTRQQMAYWMIRCSEEYLSLLYNAFKEELLQRHYIHCDETRVQVLREDGREATTQSWMWTYRTGILEEGHGIVLFNYEQTRAAYHPKTFLEGYNGFLTTDGYAAYHNLTETIEVTGCMAHARRKFNDALAIIPKDKQKGTVAYEMLKRIALLYQIEDLASTKSVDERLKIRQEESKPIFEAIFEKLSELLPATDSKSKISEAIKYALNQKQYLEKFLEDGYVPIDNNACERAIRPFANGRKAWLFCNTAHGAEASAIIYSIIETAKANNLRPYDYLKYVLEVMPQYMNGTDHTFIQNLLPWSDTLPDTCRVKK